jgi:hypothetical protein
MWSYILALCLAAFATAPRFPRARTSSSNDEFHQHQDRAAGDYVYLHTSTPISVDGQIVWQPVSSYVQGVVTMSKRSGRARAGRS